MHCIVWEDSIGEICDKVNTPTSVSDTYRYRTGIVYKYLNDYTEMIFIKLHKSLLCNSNPVNIILFTIVV